MRVTWDLKASRQDTEREKEMETADGSLDRATLVATDRVAKWGIALLSSDELQDRVLHRCSCVELSAREGYRTISGEC